jgi:hypothetical protein
LTQTGRKKWARNLGWNEEKGEVEEYGRREGKEMEIERAANNSPAVRDS